MRTCKICGTQYRLVGGVSTYEGTTPEGVKFCRSLSVCGKACREKRVEWWNQNRDTKARAKALDKQGKALAAYQSLVADGPYAACALCEAKFVTVPAAYRGLVKAPAGVKLSGSGEFCSSDCSRTGGRADLDHRNPAEKLRFSYDNGRELIEEKLRLIREGDGTE